VRHARTCTQRESKVAHLHALGAAGEVVVDLGEPALRVVDAGERPALELRGGVLEAVKSPLRNATPAPKP